VAVYDECHRPPQLAHEQKKLRTARAIATAGLELFVRLAYEEATVEDIAAAADVSPRTFFRYFRAKETSSSDRN